MIHAVYIKSRAYLRTHPPISPYLLEFSVSGQMSPSLRQCFSDFSVHRKHLEGKKKQFLGLISKLAYSVSSGWGPRIAFLTSSQVVQMLLVWGQTFRVMV